MTPEKLFFDGFVEAMIVRPYGPRLTTRAKQRLRERGLDLGAKLHPGYPSHLLVGWLDVLADELFPGTPRPQAHETIGRDFIIGWKHTLLGSAIMQVVKLLPAKRALGRLQRNFRSTDNFTVIEVTDAGPTAVRLHLHDACGSVEFFYGLLDEGATISSAKHPRCRLDAVEGAGARFTCTWEA